jgi:hypothetical protein
LLPKLHQARQRVRKGGSIAAFACQATKKRKALTEQKIKHAYNNGEKHYERKHGCGVLGKVFAGRPRKLFQFAHNVLKITADTREQVGLLLLFGGFYIVCHFYVPVLSGLLSFPVNGVLAAETAVLGELDPVGVVLLVLKSVVVTLLALGAGQGDLYAHSGY